MGSWSMTIRRSRAALVLPALACLLAAGPAAAQNAGKSIRIVMFEREGDPFYEPVRLSDGIARLQNHHPFAGAELGIRDSAALGRAADVTFQLERRSLPPEADLKAEVTHAQAEGVAAILLDLPNPDIEAAAKALPNGQ